MVAAKKQPTIVESIDRCIHTVTLAAAGSELGSVTDQVSRGLAKKLLECREMAETLQGLLGPGDAPP